MRYLFFGRVFVCGDNSDAMLHCYYVATMRVWCLLLLSPLVTAMILWEYLWEMLSRTCC